ncbi:type III polyketide synthase [Reyranella sp.]|uniref:type III polyketide synthase n=1 Tax=Reyranella sp. TaxID=1929291 RepID=UPI003BAB08A3
MPTDSCLPVALLSVAPAMPPHRLLQSDAAAAARRIFSHRYAAFERMAPVFDTAGIRSRYTVKPLDWYLGDLDWPERNAAYLEGAQELFVAAAGAALDQAGIAASEVDTIVTISSTGIATPSLEARVAGRLGFRADVERVPVFGLGCAGGVSGLAIASRLARARPGATVLMVAIEICTAAFRMDQLTSANMVATALFGDGAAAAVVRTGEDGLAQIEGAGEHLWADSLDIMGWKVDPTGLGVIFDRAIPPFAEERVGAAVEGILARIGVDRAAVDRFACHPGGAKVITALEATLRLGQGALDHERAVLEEYGNMSAPTVLFVLERLVRSGMPHRTVLTALGPGFTCSCLSLAA